MADALRYVEVAGEFGTLRGFWHSPQGTAGKPAPAVVLLHGLTGSQTSDGFILVGMARRLAAAGIAALRVDFYGSGNSDGNFVEMTAWTELSDARRIFDFAASQPGIDPKRVGVLGFSMGGGVVALLAGVEPRIRSMVAWAPSLDPRLADLLTSILSPPFYGGLELGQGFIQSLREVKPVEALAKFNGPVLVLHGDKDETVSLGSGALFAEKTGGRLQVIENANHTFDHPAWRAELFDATVKHFAETL